MARLMTQLSRVGGGGGGGGDSEERHRKVSATGSGHTHKSLDSNPFLLGASANFDEESTIFKRKNKQLKWKKKLREFYAAPITKYYCHSVSEHHYDQVVTEPH